jgi:hypothetical protein
MPDLVVSRRNDRFTMFVRLRIHVDGQYVTSLKPNQSVTLEVAPQSSQVQARLHSVLRSRPLQVPFYGVRQTQTVEVSAPFWRGLLSYLRPFRTLSIRLAEPGQASR